MTTREQQIQARCQACGGAGRRPMLPEHHNPFRSRLPAAANAMVDSMCINCNGTGRTLTKEPTMSDQVTAREVARKIADEFRAYFESNTGFDKDAHMHHALKGLRARITAALNAAVAGEWRPIETAPRDGRWLLMVSNDHMHFYRVSWAQVPHGEVWWLSADGRYYGDGLFGGWIECPHLPAAIRSPETAQAGEATEKENRHAHD